MGFVDVASGIAADRVVDAGLYRVPEVVKLPEPRGCVKTSALHAVPVVNA
jgi:hypothetical protein